MRRLKCSSCASDELHQFLDLGQSPIADAYTVSPDEVSKTHPLEVAVCRRCKLVQLLDVVDSETLFNAGYSFYSSASPPLSSYHAEYADHIMQRHLDLARRLTVEIGCNDGDMLRWFQGVPHVGVDPAAGPVSVARGRGLNVIQEEFTTLVARRIHSEMGKAGVVIANHVLAHVADVYRVMRGISTVIAKDGVAYVEVQYLPDLLVNNAFDLVYHEHRNFFSLSSLAGAAMRAGLHVADAWLTQRQGGSLRVMLQTNVGELRTSPRVNAIRDSEWWLTVDTRAYDGMQGRVERIRARLIELMNEEQHRGHVLAGYGAPAKATTLLNFCGIDASQLAFVVDSTLAKQGRVIPGTGIPIIAPAPQRITQAAVAYTPIARDYYGTDTFICLAWNYAHSIIRANPGLNWIVPIPAPMLL